MCIVIAQNLLKFDFTFILHQFNAHKIAYVVGIKYTDYPLYIEMKALNLSREINLLVLSCSCRINFLCCFRSVFVLSLKIWRKVFFLKRVTERY